MLAQAPKSWVSSPLGANLLLSLCGCKTPSVDKYIEINNLLRNKEECTINNKLLYSASCKSEKIIKNAENIQIHTESMDLEANEAKSIFRNWVTKYGEFITINTDKLFTPQTKYILANICMFKAAWKCIGSEVPVVKIYNSFNYTQDVKYEARILELPMQEEFKLILIVPNETDTLYSLFRRLCSGGLVAATNSLQPLFVSTSELEAPNIDVDSEVKIALTEESDNIYNGTAIQYGNVRLDRKEARFNVLTCLLSDKDNASNDNSANAEAPFFFAVVYNDLALFTGQYIY